MEKEKYDIFTKKYNGIYLCDLSKRMANDEYDIFEYCRRNDAEGLKTLILSDTITNINGKDMNGNTPLHYAVAYYHSKECLHLLLEAGADPNIKNMDGYTPLHYASMHNSKECLELLLEAGADINAKNNNGYTPLHIAALNNSKECLQLLLEVGADPNIKNDAGETFLHRVRDDQLRKETEEYVNALSTVNIKEPSC